MMRKVFLIAAIMALGMPALASDETARVPRLTFALPEEAEKTVAAVPATPVPAAVVPAIAVAPVAVTPAPVAVPLAVEETAVVTDAAAAPVVKADEMPVLQEETISPVVFSAPREAPSPRAPDRDRAVRLELSADRPALDFSDVTVSLNLRDMDIIDALRFIAEKANINIVPTKDVQGRVTLEVDAVSVKDVFEIVMRGNNLAYEKKGNIYNVMTEAEFKNRNGKNFYDNRITKVFRLQYAVPDQALGLLNSLKSEIGKILLDPDSGVILVMDTPEKIREMSQTLDAMDRKGVIKVFDLKYARAKDIEEQLKSQLDIKKVGSIKSDERTNQVVVQTLPERMEDIARLIQGLDTKTRQILIDAKIVQVKLNDQLDTGFQWQGLFDIGRSNKNGLTYLGSYPYSSVQATTDTWRSRSETLAANNNNIGSYPFTGTTTDYAAGTTTVATQAMHVGMINKNNDFDTVINYLKTIGETRILSNPKLAVVNNQEAKIHVGERRAYITTTTTQTQTSTTVAEAVTYVDVGIQLMVTPTINVDGYVTVKIKPEISSVIDYLETSSNNKIPIVDTSTAETIVMVKDGTSILIGGLSKEDKTLDEKGTPFLSKIPILGQAFKTSTTKTTRYEMVVMLTPHVVSGDELVTGSGTTYVGQERDKKYQDYRDFREDRDPVGYKSYQTYPFGSGTGGLPGMKPERNL